MTIGTRPRQEHAHDRAVHLDHAVHVRGLTKTYGGHVVLDRLDLDIADGELVALLGTSGSGKSTLVRAVAGLDPADTATRLSIGRTAIAFQEPRLLPWMRAWRNVAVGLEGADSPPAAGTRHATAAAMLEEVGLARHVDAWPVTLSGGEAQRVSLARALVRRPQVLMLDEPFSSLDALTRISMHQLVRRLQAERRQTTLLVTHDVDEAILLADRVLVLADGRIAAEHHVPSAPAGVDLTARHRQLKRDLLHVLGVDQASRD